MKSMMVVILSLCLFACNSAEHSGKPALKKEAKHHLNLPEKGIESLMEAHSQKIIEGTDGSIILMIGNVTRKEADITIKQDNSILVEKMVGENEDISFDYEGIAYTLKIGKIKKPLLGEGKVSLTVK